MEWALWKLSTILRIIYTNTKRYIDMCTVEKIRKEKECVYNILLKRTKNEKNNVYERYRYM